MMSHRNMYRGMLGVFLAAVSHMLQVGPCRTALPCFRTRRQSAYSRLKQIRLAIIECWKLVPPEVKDTVMDGFLLAAYWREQGYANWPDFMAQITNGKVNSEILDHHYEWREENISLCRSPSRLIGQLLLKSDKALTVAEATYCITPIEGRPEIEIIFILYRLLVGGCQDTNFIWRPPYTHLAVQFTADQRQVFSLQRNFLTLPPS